MPFELDSADKLRDNWKYLTPEQIQEKLDNEEVDIVFTAITNMSVEYRTYTGRVDVIASYRYVPTGEIILQKSAETLNVSPETAYMVAGLVVMQEPGVQAMLVNANGGAMPPILPPVIPVPSVVEIPSDEETDPNTAPGAGDNSGADPAELP